MTRLIDIPLNARYLTQATTHCDRTLHNRHQLNSHLRRVEQAANGSFYEIAKP